MNHQIGSHARRELPEIAGDSTDQQAAAPLFFQNPLTLKLCAKLLRIPNRKNDAAPAGIAMKLKQQIPSDESRGAGQQKFHKKVIPNLEQENLCRG